MCFDHDSRPPIPPIAGGALDSRELTLTAADGTRLSAFEARAAEPGGAAIVILPDVRGLHDYYLELALRFAENGIDAVVFDWFGRTAGLGRREEGFEYMPHVQQLTWDGMAADITAAAAQARTFEPATLFTVGFCMGGRAAFLTPTLGLGLAGAIFTTMLAGQELTAPGFVVQAVSAGYATASALALLGAMTSVTRPTSVPVR